MLEEGRVATRLPVQSLERARAFYSEKLGLEAAEERAGGLLYRAAGGEFALFESAGVSPGTFTQMAWEVDDIEATVTGLRSRGVVFEEVDVPGLATVNGIATIEGQYPSKGSGERAAWFRDSEGNVLGISQLLPATGARATSRMLHGRCECRAVRYRVPDAFLYAANCHCSNCRASTGSAFKPFAGIERDKLEVIDGSETLLVWGDDDANHTRCGICGSLLYSVVRDGAYVHVALGSLVDDPVIRPTRHIFAASKAPWFEINDDLPQFEEY